MESRVDCTKSHLPDDCLLAIFSKLQNATDRNAFGLTCRRWFEIQNLSRRSLVFHYDYNPKVYQAYTQYLPRLLARFPFLHSMSLAGCTELADSALEPLRNFSSTLRSFSLYCCFGVTDRGLTLVSQSCPNLVSVTLHRCNITDSGLENLAYSCRGLKNVNLTYCLQISDRGIGALIRACPVIRAVMISYCLGINGTGFKGCSSNLTYLEADSCMLSLHGLSEALSGGGLEYLNVSNLRNWVGPDGLHVIGFGFAARLRFLNLRMCRFVGDSSAAKIAEGCPLLEEWSLALCHEVRFAGWLAIGLNCNKLRLLDVSRCRNLCDRGLQALRDGCDRLEVLHTSGCAKVTSTGLEIFKIMRYNVAIRMDECVSFGPRLDDLFMQW
ncbi:F-box/LRR-repeat protein 12-like [Ananas comosus]|uniref:F-box/LRR-repeat protein 12-like n=1 Tax=Ananas comosus TaxID=4615 RepID=A0A6P5GZ20_ANACO|nr:F-box/LRR-repeat protein 12-like [Ananas comosus]